MGVLLLCMSWAAPRPAPAQAQDPVTITAVADPNPVGAEERVTLTIRVQGASPSEIVTPEPPLTRGLALQQPTPSTQRDVSFADGELTRSVTYQWTYEPVRTGTARFFPVTLTVRGTAYETDAIDVEVVPQSQRGARAPSGGARPGSPPQRVQPPASGAPLAAGQDLFIRAQPETRRVYQNEQLIIAYRLYFRSGIQLRHSRLANAWDATGFWREELEVESRPVPRAETLNGQTYQTIVLKRVALFPTRTGSLRVDPLEIETEARATRRYGRDPIYAPQGSFEKMGLASDALTIEAEPLPPGAPDGFDGAVGEFQLRATVDSSRVAVGRPVRMRIRIRGTGNIATLQPPAIEPPDAVEVYDPQENTAIDRDGDRVTGTKTFTYVLVPQSDGVYRLPPATFSYFDPAERRYRTLRAALPDLRVTGDRTPAAVSTTGDGLPVDDVASLMTAPPTWTRTEARALYRSPWPYAALLAPLFALGGVAATRRLTAAPSDDTPSEATTQSAAHLDRARHHLRAQQPEACYDAVERAVLHFIGQRLGVAAAGLTRPHLNDLLARRDVPERAREALFELLDVCDQARYSPAQPTENAMRGAISRAEQLIDFLDAPLT